VFTRSVMLQAVPCTLIRPAGTFSRGKKG
jgi:hypothetical protein